MRRASIQLSRRCFPIQKVTSTDLWRFTPKIPKRWKHKVLVVDSTLNSATRLFSDCFLPRSLVFGLVMTPRG